MHTVRSLMTWPHQPCEARREGKRLAKKGETVYGLARCGSLGVRGFKTSSLLEKIVMLKSRKRTLERDLRRYVMALTALVGVTALLGFFCHLSEVPGLATGHTPLGQPSAEHCWTAIGSLPTLAFIPLRTVFLSFSLTPQGRFLFDLLFKPPRAFMTAGH